MISSATLQPKTILYSHSYHLLPNNRKAKRPTSRHEVIKMSEVKGVREKQIVTYKEIPITLSASFSADMLQARREEHDIFKLLKEEKILTKNTQF